ncbi:MAG: Stealth CR1 domain-containing protein [Flavobacteriaceae bacterium]|nr:Stealth CR1 domain-containing protein [Flavobacteriaceae bacterium]
MNKSQDQFTIDAVIMWVDGNDENHQKKIADNITETNLLKDLDFKTRFQHVGEIKFTVHSIIKYAPFIRNIFIVTDNQIPDFLVTKSERYKKVVVIDHKDIYTDNLSCLPVFNSISIETKLYKIPGLAEHFIYFNDDFLLNKVVNPSDFFHEGKPIIRGKWHRFKEDIFYKKIFRKKEKPGYIIAQEKSAKILGYKLFFRFHHTPHPMRVSTVRSFFTSNSSLEQSNSEPKFRSIDQFLMVGLANHLEIKKDQCVLKKDYKLLHFRNYKKPLFWLKFKLNYLSKKQNRLFLNLQSLDQCPKLKQDFIIDWLTKKYAI